MIKDKQHFPDSAITVTWMDVGVLVRGDNSYELFLDNAVLRAIFERQTEIHSAPIQVSSV